MKKEIFLNGKIVVDFEYHTARQWNNWGTEMQEVQFLGKKEYKGKLYEIIMEFSLEEVESVGEHTDHLPWDDFSKVVSIEEIEE